MWVGVKYMRIPSIIACRRRASRDSRYPIYSVSSNESSMSLSQCQRLNCFHGLGRTGRCQFFHLLMRLRLGKLTVVPYGETEDPAVQTSDRTSHICNRPLCCDLTDVDWFMY